MFNQTLAFLPKVRLGNPVGYSSLISTLSTTNNVDEMFFIYARMKEERVPLNISCAAALINASLRHNRLDRALEVLHDMKINNVRVDNGLINSFVSHFLEKRDVDRLLAMLNTLDDRSGITVDRVSVLDDLWQKLASPHEDLSLACQFIDRLTAAMPKPTTNAAPNKARPRTTNEQSLQIEEAKEGEGEHVDARDRTEEEDDDEGNEEEEEEDMRQAREKWEQVTAYWSGPINTLLVHLVSRGYPERAQDLVELMIARWQLQPSRRILTRHIRACGAHEGRQEAAGDRPTLLARLGRMVEQGTLNADVITFTALIDAHARLRRKEEAFHYLEVMRQRGIKCDLVPYKVLLILCSMNKDKAAGLRLLAEAERDGCSLADESDLGPLAKAIRALPDPPATANTQPS